MYTLRSYQQEAVDKIIDHVKASTDSCILEAATGAGKSMIIAEVAKILHELSKGKNVLCLAPSAELVKQNRSKYLQTGENASVFSASAGGRCLKYPVVFGTPLTVLNSIDQFSGKFCAIIIDECDLITPTVKAIIEKIKEGNPKLRVIGTTATPYRMGTGYIYQMNEDNKAIGKDAYFVKKVYTIGAPDLIDQKYLAPPLIGAINSGHYDTIGMAVNKMGKFNKDDVDRAYKGQGRKTSLIVADVIEQSKDRKGVMFFAATVQHAEEILASLPPAISALITGKTKAKERSDTIEKFKNQQIKYIVNVSVLTVGFDAPHVDVIALLRATESGRLLQQVIGRGLRPSLQKDDVLILDYAENIERHCPDGDVFNPEIESYNRAKTEKIWVECPDCNEKSEVSGRKNDEGYGYSPDGYFTDLDGEKVKTEHGFMPSHHGRRCTNYSLVAGHYERCEYRWTLKNCENCNAKNDIAARYCFSCKKEMVNPNDKLKADFAAMKKDPTKVQCDAVTSWIARRAITRQGANCITVDIKTTYRPKGFRVWFMPHARDTRSGNAFLLVNKMTNGFSIVPTTITYRKKYNSKFYEVLNYNQPEDVPNEVSQ
jgi:DNA repair protein RadD